jgi:gamma-glutamylaminecyclotransferase
MKRIFAFGTLKRGFPLHQEGLSRANYLGDGRTVERFRMFIAGPWFAPMMLNRPGSGLRVRGELYEIEDAQLAIIEALESIGQPGNERIVVEGESHRGRTVGRLSVCQVAGYRDAGAHRFDGVLSGSQVRSSERVNLT